MKIALAFSGGGFRATVFHLGVMARLAEENRLEEVTFLSTVSGGSLCAGMVFALNGYRWPTSAEYIQKVAPEARRLLTTKDLQRAIIFRVLTSIWNIADTRADDLSMMLQKEWGINARLSDLPETPRWMINATCYETGKNWRFERFRMGDYLFGYSYDTDLPLSDAMAASSGFPGLVGALTLEARGRSWFKYKDTAAEGKLFGDPQAQRQRTTEPTDPPFSAVHLWDGGVYDNHGLEGLHNFVQGWRENVEFLIVSDAAGRSKPEPYSKGVKALLRITTGIMMDQIRSLRSRAIIERLVNHSDKDRGGFLQIGNTCQHVLRAAGRKEDAERLCGGCLSKEEADFAANMATVIRRLSDKEYDTLFRHGFEVADYTLYAYNDQDYNYIGFANSHWG